MANETVSGHEHQKGIIGGESYYQSALRFELADTLKRLVACLSEVSIRG